MEANTLEIFIDPSLIDGKKPVLFAYRSSENKLFLLGEKPLENPDELLTDISFDEIIKLDTSLSEVEDLPQGYTAYRKKATAAWKTAQFDPKTGRGEYLDGLSEWMNKMYVDGYFTGGTVPHFYTFPGNPKLYGWVSTLGGLILLGTIFIIGRLNDGEITEKPIGPAILGLFFLFIGVSLLLRSRKK